MTKEIRLTNTDQVALVDDYDYEECLKYVWHLDGGYPRNGKTHKRLHAVIMGTAPQGHVTDHINRDPLDNRRANLRFVFQSINMANSSKLNDPMNCIQMRGDAYRVRIRRQKKEYHIGYFRTVLEAQTARDKFVAENFPDPLRV